MAGFGKLLIMLSAVTIVVTGFGLQPASGGNSEPGDPQDGATLINFLEGAQDSQGARESAALDEVERVLAAMEELEAWSPESDVIRWPENFRKARAIVREKFPNDYAAGVVNVDQLSGWVGFAGEVPEEAVAVFDGMDGVEFRADLGASARDLADASDRVFLALSGVLGPSTLLMAYPDIVERRIVIEHQSSVTVVGTGIPIKDIITKVVTEAGIPSGFRVDVFAQEDPQRVELQMLHGARLLANACTGAFPVKRKGGNELGILTAAHCPGTGSYDGTADAFNQPYAYSISTEAGSGGGEFRWNHSRYGLTGLTFVGHGKPLRSFGSRDFAEAGDILCNYGVVSDYKCDRVAQCNLQVSGVRVPDNGQYYTVGGMCRTDHAYTDWGDSGGPWFVNYTAFGIHSGVIVNSNNVPLYSMFSQVNNALNKTRVNLVVDAAGNTAP